MRRALELAIAAAAFACIFRAGQKSASAVHPVELHLHAPPRTLTLQERDQLRDRWHQKYSRRPWPGLGAFE